MSKIRRRAPSGRIVVRERRKKPKTAKCANCGSNLHGVPRLRPVKLRKSAKTKKRPERVFGGYYCAACIKEIFREKTRGVV